MKQYIKYRVHNDREADEKIGAETATVNEEPSLTQQQFAEDADINVIVRRFGLDKHAVPPVPLDASYYGDFSNVPDLRTAMDLVNDATNKFMDLPAKLRERFDNNPAKLWHFVNDPENGPEAVRLGLLREAVQNETPPPAGEAGGTSIP